MTPTTSLLDRANLDRDSVRIEVVRGLAGADDGELFLEYSQTEALMFDNGRLKQATYDTSQGFGLRAVKDDAVGYAHSSDVSLPALIRAGGRGRRGARRLQRHFRRGPAHTNVRLYGDDNPLDAPGFEAKVKLLAEIDAYVRDKDPRVRQVSVSLGATWQVVEILRPDGESYRDIRPLVRVNVSVVAGQGDRQESGSKGYGGREGYARFIETKAWREAADGAMREAMVNLESVPAPAGEMDVVLGAGLARRDAARGRRPRAGRRLQPQEDVGFRRPDGPAGRRQGRHRGRRRHHGLAARLAVDRRRGHADQPHRADRGRHPGRLHAGPPECPADEHEADRQRPPPGLCPCADAAHDQHLHAGGPAAIPAEILASVKNGIYAANFGGGQVDITSGKYVFQCTEAYKIENGKIGAPLKGAMLIGNGPTDLHRITMIGNDLALDTGIGTCGKNGQGVPVGVGQPTLRMERITVGGTGA